MAALQDDNQPTGNPRAMGSLLFALCFVAAVFIYASHRQNVQNRKTTAGTSQSQAARPTAEDETAHAQTDTNAPTDQEQNIQDTVPKTQPTEQGQWYTLDYVTDGDTIRVRKNNVVEKVRLIGIDAPETHDPKKGAECYGNEATEYLRSFVGGSLVRLEPDATQQDKDVYGRLLRYAFLPNGTNVNLQLIAEGYAKEYTYRVPYVYQSQFKQAQATAKSSQKGLWSTATCKH